MKPTTLFKFLQKSCDLNGHDDFVKQSLIEVEVEGWKGGYFECLKHVKKRRQLEKERATKETNALLDDLSDLAHK